MGFKFRPFLILFIVSMVLMANENVQKDYPYTIYQDEKVTVRRADSPTPTLTTSPADSPYSTLETRDRIRERKMEAYIRKTFDSYMCPKEQAKFQSPVTEPIITSWNQHTTGTSLRDHNTPNMKKNWGRWWRSLTYTVYKFSFYSLITLVKAWHVYSFICYLIHYRHRVHSPTGDEEEEEEEQDLVEGREEQHNQDPTGDDDKASSTSNNERGRD